MYGNIARIRSLCINLRNGLDDDFIMAHAERADAKIDAKIAERFYWPVDPNGDDISASPPPLIVQIANLLTAAYCERSKFSINEASGQPMGNPYAANMEKEANIMLEDLVAGTLIIRTLTEITQIRGSKSPSGFNAIGGFKSKFLTR